MRAVAIRMGIQKQSLAPRAVRARRKPRGGLLQNAQPRNSAIPRLPRAPSRNRRRAAKNNGGAACSRLQRRARKRRTPRGPRAPHRNAPGALHGRKTHRRHSDAPPVGQRTRAPIARRRRNKRPRRHRLERQRKPRKLYMGRRDSHDLRKAGNNGETRRIFIHL